MQEFAFVLLWSAVAVVLIALVYCGIAIRRAKDEDEFHQSYQATRHHGEKYRKTYRGKEVGGEQEESSESWLEDFQKGDGFDKRFWSPPEA